MVEELRRFDFSVGRAVSFLSECFIIRRVRRTKWIRPCPLPGAFDEGLVILRFVSLTIFLAFIKTVKN